jgi:hypothetical protein
VIRKRSRKTNTYRGKEEDEGPGDDGIDV